MYIFRAKKVLLRTRVIKIFENLNAGGLSRQTEYAYFMQTCRASKQASVTRLVIQPRYMYTVDACTL